MIVDTSALLASLFGEEKGIWVEDQLNRFRGSLMMSTVNMAEVFILLREKQPTLFSELRKTLFRIPIRFIPLTESQAELAATARHKYASLNFGDCFAYALAKEEESPLLTLDGGFKNTDLKVLMP